MSSQPVVAQLLYSGLGGHGGVVFALIDADQQRHWNHRLGFLGIEPLLPAYAERCEEACLPFRYFRAIAGKPWRSYRAIYSWLAHARPDIVLLHSPPALLPVWLYCRRYKVFVVVIEHQHNKLKSRQEQLFDRAAMLLADAVVVLTPFYRAELATALGRVFRADKVHLIHNGIDTQALQGARPLAQPTTNVIRIGMAARFTRGKRFDLVLDMLRVLRSRHPENQWQLSLAGAGEQWDDVRRSTDADTFGESLVFEGMLSGAALNDWYRGLDIYCHASDGETLSISVLQAMAAGLPIVASDVGGISNLLSGKLPSGMLVEEQSGSAFADTVARLVSNPPKAQAMGQQARSIAEADYSSQAMFDAYNNLVRKLLARRIS